MTLLLDSFAGDLGVEEPIISVPFLNRMVTLCVDGRPVYKISAGCGTCGYLLSLQPEAHRVESIDEIRDRLAGGITKLDDDLIQTFGELLPAGAYRAALLEVQPTNVQPGDPNDYFSQEMVASWGPPHEGESPSPGTPYYRLGTTPFIWETRHGYDEVAWPSALFEFLLPLTVQEHLDGERVEHFRDAIKQGARPTAIAFSLLDIQRWAVKHVTEPALEAHWIWSHFLLDGHHKVRAAALENQPITLLTFTAVDAGLSEDDEVQQAMNLMGTP